MTKAVKLYACFLGINEHGDYEGVTVNEDGHTATTHISSSIGWLKNDLGFKAYIDDYMFNSKRKDFDNMFGEGNWTIQWCENGLPENVPILTKKEKKQ